MQAMKPELFSALEDDVNGVLKESKTIINEFMNDVFTLLKRQGIVIDDIEGRPKSLSSIRSKQISKSMDSSSKVSCFLKHSLQHAIFAGPCTHNQRQSVICKCARSHL